MDYFEYRIGGSWGQTLLLRQSSSASAAQSWLLGEFGIRVLFRHHRREGWYVLAWTGDYPRLRQLLRQRAEQERQ